MHVASDGRRRMQLTSVVARPLPPISPLQGPQRLHQMIVDIADSTAVVFAMKFSQEQLVWVQVARRACDAPLRSPNSSDVNNRCDGGTAGSSRLDFLFPSVPIVEVDAQPSIAAAPGVYVKTEIARVHRGKDHGASISKLRRLSVMAGELPCCPIGPGSTARAHGNPWLGL